MKKETYLYIVPRQNFFSEGYRGRVMHALGIAEGLYENGKEVHLVGGRDLRKFTNDIPEGVKLIEIEENGSKFFGYFSWYFKLLKKIRSLKKDTAYNCVVIRYAMSSYPAILLICSMFKGIKKVIEVNLFGYQYYFKRGTFLNQAFAYFENCLCNCFDVLYVVSDAMKEDSRTNAFNGLVVSIPNGASSKKINYKSSPESGGNTRLVYLGSLMDYWDYDPLIQAVNNSGENYEFHVYGTGPKESYLKESLKCRENVFFNGRFSRNELGDILNRETDILLLPPKTLSDMENSGGLSTKAFDYMTMELPILVPSDGELLNIYRDRFNSLVYDRNNWEEVNQSVDILSKDRELRERLSENAHKQFLENYSWRSRMKVLIDSVSIS